MLVNVDELLTSIQFIIASEVEKLKRSADKTTLTFGEACTYLGYSKSHLYKLTSAGIIPFSKPTGKKIYFDKNKLDEWLLSNSSSSSHEKEVKASTYISSRR